MCKSIHLPERLSPWNLITEQSLTSLSMLWRLSLSCTLPHKQPRCHQNPQPPLTVCSPFIRNSPSPRCPAGPQLTAFASSLSSAGNSHLPLVYQTDPAHPLSLSSDTLSSGSSSRIAQADLRTSSPGPLTQRRRHTHKSTTAIVSLSCIYAC